MDALDWLPVPAARGMLSYPHDDRVLDEFAAAPADTVPLVLLRHASAGGKDTWPGNDLDRPLDAGGAAESDLLARLLSCYGPCRVISSAAERCVATVRPYAALTGAKVEIEPALTVGPARGAGPGRLRGTWLRGGGAVVAGGLPAVVCAPPGEPAAAAGGRLRGPRRGPPAARPAAQGAASGCCTSPAAPWPRRSSTTSPSRDRRGRRAAAGLTGLAAQALRLAASQSRVGGSAPSSISSQRLTSGPCPPL